MPNKDQEKALLSAAAAHLSEKEMQLSVMQGFIAAEIAVKRAELGLSQEDFAKKMGVSQGLVSRWENGDTNFTLSTLVDIALKLDLEMQSPFVPRQPAVYSHGSNIICFPTQGPNDYKIYSQGCTGSYEVNSESESDIKEM